MTSEYPHPDGETTVLGPEIFASKDGEVICWKGQNYTAQCPPHEGGKECPCVGGCGCCEVVASSTISPRLAEVKAFWRRLQKRRGRQQ